MSIASERCRRRIRPALLILACSLAITGCDHFSAAPTPNAALLLPCKDPELVPDPDSATAEQINIERINVARAYVDCKQRQADLAKWVRGK